MWVQTTHCKNHEEHQPHLISCFMMLLLLHLEMIRDVESFLWVKVQGVTLNPNPSLNR